MSEANKGGGGEAPVAITLESILGNSSAIREALLAWTTAAHGERRVRQAFLAEEGVSTGEYTGEDDQPRPFEYVEMLDLHQEYQKEIQQRQDNLFRTILTENLRPSEKLAFLDAVFARPAEEEVPYDPAERFRQTLAEVEGINEALQPGQLVRVSSERTEEYHRIGDTSGLQIDIDTPYGTASPRVVLSLGPTQMVRIAPMTGAHSVTVPQQDSRTRLITWPIEGTEPSKLLEFLRGKDEAKRLSIGQPDPNELLAESSSATPDRVLVMALALHQLGYEDLPILKESERHTVQKAVIGAIFKLAMGEFQDVPKAQRIFVQYGDQADSMLGYRIELANAGISMLRNLVSLLDISGAWVEHSLRARLEGLHEKIVHGQAQPKEQAAYPFAGERIEYLLDSIFGSAMDGSDGTGAYIVTV